MSVQLQCPQQEFLCTELLVRERRLASVVGPTLLSGASYMQASVDVLLLRPSEGRRIRPPSSPTGGIQNLGLCPLDR